MILNEHLQQQAAELVMQDLIECFFSEGLFAYAEQEFIALNDLRPYQHALHGLQTEQQLWRWWLNKDPEFFVVMPVETSIAQAVRRIADAPVYAVKAEPEREAFQVFPLDPISLTELVLSTLPADMAGQPKGGELFLAALTESVQQTAWSLSHHIKPQGLLTKTPAECFQLLEQWSSLRDRPFHPIAKAKLGFNHADYVQYMAEFGQAVALNWVAVARSCLRYGNGLDVDQPAEPADFLLNAAQQAALQQELQQRGLADSHMALPVHPWQLQHILPQFLADEQQAGIYQVLDFKALDMLATSSVRSMAPRNDSPHYLKLPLHIYSLGASRYLPAVKMINGQRSEHLMRQVLPLDASLPARVHLCEEGKWWAYLPENGSLYDDAPRHLSAMVRTYPAQLLQDSAYRLIPMAALGTLLPAHNVNQPSQHFFDHWLSYRQLNISTENVLQLFRELCHCFFDINLRMFRLGILAELHGQNAVLVWQDGQAQGVLFRDHDSLRLYVPWLLENGLSDPCYEIKPGHPNTLYHDNAEDLLFYLQTLGIQVNLRAIIETLASRYALSETVLWSSLRQVLAEVIDNIEFSESVRQMLQQQLFDAEEWPLKLLIKPMIERAGGPGSMPFGKGRLGNPLYQLKAAQS